MYFAPWNTSCAPVTGREVYYKVPTVTDNAFGEMNVAILCGCLSERSVISEFVSLDGLGH